MAPVWILITIAIALNGTAALVGGFLSEGWLARRKIGLVAFASGAMLSAVVTDIFPEAVDACGWRAFPYAVIGLLVFFASDRVHVSHRRAATAPAVSLLFSDTLHNIGDGAAIAAAFLTSNKAGWLVTLSVISHELPQELGDYAILRAGGWKKSAALAALSLVQLSGAIGAIAVVFASTRFERFEGVVLGVAAGGFLYTALVLMRRLHGGRMEALIGLLVAVAVVVALQWMTH